MSEDLSCLICRQAIARNVAVKRKMVLQKSVSQSVFLGFKINTVFRKRGLLRAGEGDTMLTYSRVFTSHSRSKPFHHAYNLVLSSFSST